MVAPRGCGEVPGEYWGDSGVGGCESVQASANLAETFNNGLYVRYTRTCVRSCKSSTFSVKSVVLKYWGGAPLVGRGEVPKGQGLVERYRLPVKYCVLDRSVPYSVLLER